MTDDGRGNSRSSNPLARVAGGFVAFMGSGAWQGIGGIVGIAGLALTAYSLLAGPPSFLLRVVAELPFVGSRITVEDAAVGPGTDASRAGGAAGVVVTVVAPSASGGASAPASDPASRVAKVELANAPSPAPWSGAPITGPACSGVENTWFFAANFSESGGLGVTFTEVVNTIDGTTAPPLTNQLRVPAGGSLGLNRAFCFRDNREHSIQTTFRGSDELGRPVIVEGAAVRLLPRTP